MTHAKTVSLYAYSGTMTRWGGGPAPGRAAEPQQFMDITINLSDGVPIYRQIANQIRYMVASGLLEPGEEIPSIRTLALRLKVILFFDFLNFLSTAKVTSAMMI